MDNPRFPDNPVFSGQRVREVLAAQVKDGMWLAAQTGYSNESVSRFINGKRQMPRKFAVRAADALGVPLHWLLEEEAAVA